MKRLYPGSAILVAQLVLASSACAFGLGTATEAKPAHGPEGAVQVHVTNHAAGPMEIYAAGSGASYRIGTVYSGLAGRFVLRPVMMVNGPVEFLARSNSGPLFRSGPILLVPGDVVDLELGANPVTSNATVRSWRRGVE